MLAATGLALSHYWRGQITSLALPPAALTFGGGEVHIRTRLGKIHAPSEGHSTRSRA